MEQVKRLQGNQLLRNSLQMATIFNNSVEAINAQIGIYNQSLAIVEKFQQNTTRKSTPEHTEFLHHRTIVSSFDAHGCIAIDGRQPQNKGLKQFYVYGTSSQIGNTIWGFESLEQAHRFLLKAIDFTTDMRFNKRCVFHCSSIKILFVQTVDSDGRPLSGEWVNWDGENHVWIWAHNESLTFEGTQVLLKKALEKITEPGEYNVLGFQIYVRKEDLDFQVKKGMNYNLRKIISAIYHGYVGANNWIEKSN